MSKKSTNKKTKGNEYKVIDVSSKALDDKSMVWGYARCSKNSDVQDITRQTRELTELGADRIVLEYVSGAKADRSGFNYMLENVKEGHTIKALEVSRITRSTSHLCEVIDIVKDKGLKLDVGSLVIDCTKTNDKGEKQLDPMTEGMLKMMGVFAELERNMTRQRILSGLENAKAKGTKLGRKELAFEDLPKSFIKYYPRYAKGELKVAEYARLCETSRTTIYRWINVYENNNE